MFVEINGICFMYTGYVLCSFHFLKCFAQVEKELSFHTWRILLA